MPDRTASAAGSTERSLVRAVASGDEAAASQLFRTYGEPVLRFIYRRVGEQMEDAEEITLDTFASAVKLAPTYDVRATVFTWLCGIAKLRIIDFYRKAGRDKRIPAEFSVPLDETIEQLRSRNSDIERVLDKVETERIVDEMLTGLSADEREALLLRYVEQLSVREIATLMKRSDKGVEALLARAKNKPRAILERWLDGGGL